MPEAGKLVTYGGRFNWTDWNEAFEMSSPNQYSLTQTKGDVTLVGDIEWGLLEACVQWLLGYAYVGPAPDYKLKRVLPQRHPKFRWLWCNGISGIQGKGARKLEGVNGVAKLRDLTAPRFLPDGMISGNYERAIVHATFGPTTYKVLADDALVDNVPVKEYQRHCTVKCKPYVELLRLDNGQLLYDCPVSNPDLNNKPIISPQVRIKQKKNCIDLTWHQVPLEFICDNNGVPEKLLNMQKCVNQNAFLGRAPGTLLCEEIDFDIGTFPIATTVTGVNQLCAEAVRFKLIEFNPLRDPGEPPPPAAQTYGWNNWPSNNPNGYYYKAKMGEAGGAAKAFDEFPFESAFTHHSL